MDDLKYRTGRKRIWAAIVDIIVFMPLLLVERWLFTSTENNTLIILWQIFYALIPIFYSIILHYRYGQTIGKWVAGVKVVDVSEAKPLNLKQSILRDIFYLLVQVAGICYFLFLVFQTDNQGYSIYDYNNFSGTPVFVWTLLELITMLTNYKRRAIHDFLAKSVVVRT